MRRSSLAIASLCSHVARGDSKPLEPREWSVLEGRLRAVNAEASELFSFSSGDFCDRLNMTEQESVRLLKLLDRAPELLSVLERYGRYGVHIVTRADEEYPGPLLSKLGGSSPPVFYFAGSLELLGRPAIGVVGSRNAGAEALDIAKQVAARLADTGYALVSGGARGVDRAAEDAAAGLGGSVVEFLSDSLLRRLERDETGGLLNGGRVLLLTAAHPDAGFSAGLAMMRNRYIHALGTATVAIETSLGRGGTWAGCIDNIKHRWSRLYCWDNGSSGNAALIARGAIPLTQETLKTFPPPQAPEPDERYEQTSLF